MHATGLSSYKCQWIGAPSLPILQRWHLRSHDSGTNSSENMKTQGRHKCLKLNLGGSPPLLCVSACCTYNVTFPGPGSPLASYLLTGLLLTNTGLSSNLEVHTTRAVNTCHPKRCLESLSQPSQCLRLDWGYCELMAPILCIRPFSCGSKKGQAVPTWCILAWTVVEVLWNSGEYTRYGTSGIYVRLANSQTRATNITASHKGLLALRGPPLLQNHW